MSIDPGQGQTTPGDTIYMPTETSCHFGHLLQVSKHLWSQILYIYFMILYMYIAPGQGLITLWDEILMSADTSCHFGHLLQVSKKYLWSLILYNFFHDLIHVYSPGAGTDSPQSAKVWCQQKGLITLPICGKFQRNLFQVWFNTIFFMI